MENESLLLMDCGQWIQQKKSLKKWLNKNLVNLHELFQSNINFDCTIFNVKNCSNCSNCIKHFHLCSVWVSDPKWPQILLFIYWSHNLLSLCRLDPQLMVLLRITSTLSFFPTTPCRAKKLVLDTVSDLGSDWAIAIFALPCHWQTTVTMIILKSPFRNVCLFARAATSQVVAPFPQPYKGNELVPENLFPAIWEIRVLGIPGNCLMFRFPTLHGVKGQTLPIHFKQLPGVDGNHMPKGPHCRVY